MIKQISFFLALSILPYLSFSQEKEDLTKMFRDVVNVQVDRAKYAPSAPAVTPVVHDGKGKKNHKKAESPAEPVADTLGPLIPAPSGEIVKRAQNWYNLKATKFTKANGSTSGNMMTCNVSFAFKQKMLNPENAVDGKIMMDVIVEAKEGKYRYTIKNIKHVALKPEMSGGDVYLTVPEAGSMNINDNTWKHIRSEAFTDAKLVIEDMKTKMTEEVKSDKDEW
ncbi:MAG: hypothetical protein JWO32_3093 [Bacteroidetes bacterium]|nr:hypothetical protein [Bacteroidota bacterium]